MNIKSQKCITNDIDYNLIIQFMDNSKNKYPQKILNEIFLVKYK